MTHLSFRPIVESDRDFLNAVYASTRAEEMKLVDWDDEQKKAFLDTQFSLQHQYYQQHYTENTEFLIILLNGFPDWTFIYFPLAERSSNCRFGATS